MLSVVYNECRLYWVLFILSVIYTEFHLHWVSFMISVTMPDITMLSVLAPLRSVRVKGRLMTGQIPNSNDLDVIWDVIKGTK